MINFRLDIEAPKQHFSHYWEQSVGSGHAVMGLRSDWREQLKKSHDELGFQYVRFHGLLDDDMSVCIREEKIFAQDEEDSLRYTFFNIDSIFDYLLEIGMKPFIELGFMPSALASGAETCFHYRANITPPADYEEWGNLIQMLTQHLVNRYGLDEVRTWFFEVWNEPNLKFFWAGTQEEYFKLYEYAVRAIKRVDSDLRVGGPATSINAWIPDMLNFCREFDVPIDFLSTHHYPTDDPLWRNSDMSIEEFFRDFRDEMGKYQRGVLHEMSARAREQAGDMPLYYTEWNTSAMLPDSIHDESYAAALVAKTIADNDGLVDGYAFWTFSDLFEERGQFGKPFHGGFGLQTIHGIPKPTYRVYEMFHKLGHERLVLSDDTASTVEILAVRDDTNLHLLLYNHNVPGAEITSEEITIAIKGISSQHPATIERIDEQNCNPKQKWVDMGSPEYPTSAELNAIHEASQLIVHEQAVENTDDGCKIHLRLAAHAVALLTIPLLD